MNSKPIPDSTTPRVLVLLASYNGEPWIAHQLESIFAQRGVESWVAVRDDGSSDQTLQEIARCQAGRRLSLSPRRGRTGAAARNFLELIREHDADGFDFIAFSDQDDIWHPEKLRRACRCLRDTGCGGYSSATLAAWPHGRTVLLAQSCKVTAADFLFEGAGQGCTFVLRADFYAQARRFVLQHPELMLPIHYHDWLLYALARSWKWPWAFDAWPSVTYRQHDGNDTGARRSWPAVRKRLALMRSGWYLDQLRAIAAVCAAAAPRDPLIAAWNSLVSEPLGLRRRWRLAQFCLSAGRRKALDNAALVLAALAGWI